MAMQGCAGKDGVARRKRRGAGTAQGVNWVFLGKNGWSRVPMQSEMPGEFHGQRSLTGYSPWGHKRVGLY